MLIAWKIISTHGIKGEVKVQKITDFPERFEIGNTVYAVNQENEAIPLTIDGFRSHKNNLLLHFEGYDSIDDALRLKGLDLKIKASQQEELGKNEYYYHEIIGAKRSEEHTSELQSRFDLVCRLLLEKKKYISFFNYTF